MGSWKAGRAALVGLGWAALNQLMAGIKTKLKPLVQHHVAPPSQVEFFAMRCGYAAQYRVTMVGRQAHHLGQMAVKIDAQSKIWIGE